MATPEGNSRRPSPSSVKESFEAAVKVIRSLPSEGSYQPSNIAKLRFYALYKQAKEGPCNIPKPNFWDAVGRAKWEAWKTCGMMKKEMAMQLYVDELKQVVETMPQSKEVEDFMRTSGPIFEFEEDEEETEKRKPSETGSEAAELSNSKPPPPPPPPAQATPDTSSSTVEWKSDGGLEPLQELPGNGSPRQPAPDVLTNQIDPGAQHDPINGLVPSPTGKKLEDATGETESATGVQEGVESGTESDESEDFQESFQDLPERRSMPASSSDGGFFSPISQSQSLTDRSKGYPSKTTPARSPKSRSAYCPPRLLVSTERGLEESSRLTIPMFGHAQQPSLEVQRGRGGLQRSPWQAVRGDGGRDTERDEVRASRMGGKQDQEYNGEESEAHMLPLDPAQHLPQALEAVTSQLQQLQLQLQAVLGQMNTTALAVHGVVQLYHQHTGVPLSHQPDLTSNLTDLTPNVRQVPGRFHGSRRWLRLCLRLGPPLVVWPLVVNLIMSYLYRRFGASPAGSGFPSWMWGTFTLLQVAFSLVYGFFGPTQ